MNESKDKGFTFMALGFVLACHELVTISKAASEFGDKAGAPTLQLLPMLWSLAGIMVGVYLIYLSATVLIGSGWKLYKTN